MKTALSFSLFAALFAISANAAECPASLEIRDVKLLADGRVVRTERAEKISNGQNGKKVREYVSVIRDSVKITYGDEFLLNSAIGVEDALFQVKVTFLTQELDMKGVFSTTYDVTEISTSLFGGPNVPHNTTYKSYTAKIISNYAGNGKYNRGCGIVNITNEKTYTN